jgi:hypothetical protein
MMSTVKKGLDKTRSFIGSVFGEDMSKLKAPRPEKIEVDRSKLTIFSGRELPGNGLSGLPKSVSSGLPQSGLSPGLPKSVSSGLPQSGLSPGLPKSVSSGLPQSGLSPGLPKSVSSEVPVSSGLSSLPRSNTLVSSSQKSLNEVAPYRIPSSQNQTTPKSLEEKLEAVAQKSKNPGEKKAARAALERIKPVSSKEVKEVTPASSKRAYGKPTAEKLPGKPDGFQIPGAHSAFQEALYGAGVGAASGAGLSFLQGGSILEGAMYGAGFGAAFSGGASMAGGKFAKRQTSDGKSATWGLSQRGISRHAPGVNGAETSKMGMRHYQMAGGIGGFLGSSNRKKNHNHLKANGWANGTHPMYFR